MAEEKKNWKTQKPCQNSSCPSFGRPHPNCKCWGGGYYKGGVIESVCVSKHNKGCEYYSGGEVSDMVDVLNPQGILGSIPANQVSSALSLGYTLAEDNTEETPKDQSKIKELLKHINSNEYEYKDEFKDKELAGDGTYVTPMAQELEQSELGSDMVMDTPEGKVVDYGKGFGTILAAQADLQKRIEELEKKKGKK